MMKKIYTIVVIGALCLIIPVILWKFTGQNTTNVKPDNETIIVGTNAEYPPFTFIEDGSIVGFDIDVMKEVAKRLKKTIEWRDMSFDMLIPQCQLGTIQVIAAGLTPTQERAQHILFTKPYISGDMFVILSPAHKPLQSLEDLEGKNVIVNEGYTTDIFLSGVPNINLQHLATVAQACAALQSKLADAFVTSKQSLQLFLEQDVNHEFVIAPIAGTEQTTALAVSKHYPALLHDIQKALDAMQHDGTLESLKQKWNIHD